VATSLHLKNAIKFLNFLLLLTSHTSPLLCWGAEEFTFLVRPDIHEVIPLAFDPNNEDALFITVIAGNVFKNVKETYI